MTSTTTPKYKNKIKCKSCNTILESKFTHDYQKCKCGKVFVDGGLSYRRVGYPSGDPNDWIDYIWEEVGCDINNAL